MTLTSSEVLSDKWPSEIQRLAFLIVTVSTEKNLDPNLFAAVLYKESWFPAKWQPGYTRCPDGPVTGSCTSVANAIGPAQVMPFEAGFSGRPTIAELRNEETNLRRGAAILSSYIAYMGSVRGGLAAYNCGPSGATRNQCGATGGWVYADHVLELYATFK